jgi:chromosomal replication initiation ATPase DnaA
MVKKTEYIAAIRQRDRAQQEIDRLSSLLGHQERLLTQANDVIESYQKHLNTAERIQRMDEESILKATEAIREHFDFTSRSRERGLPIVRQVVFWYLSENTSLSQSEIARRYWAVGDRSSVCQMIKRHKELREFDKESQEWESRLLPYFKIKYD